MGFKKHKCCLVWGLVPDEAGVLAIGCPHCGLARHRIEAWRTTTAPDLQRKVDESQANHARMCNR